MKNLFLICFICLCVVGIAFSHFHYKDKLANIAAAAREEDKLVVTSESTQPIVELANDQEPPVPKERPNEVGGLLGHWVEQKENKDAIHLSYFGSLSLVNKKDPKKGWTNLVTSELTSLLEQQEITSTVIEVGEKRSIDVLYSDYIDEVIKSEPDILLVEPLILNDAGVISIEDSLSNIKKILTTIKKELPEISIVLVPANPLLNASYYSKKTEEDLANFAIKEGYDYANHWGNWPSTNDTKELQKYLDNGRPNAAGHEVWAEYIVEYVTTD